MLIRILKVLRSPLKVVVLLSIPVLVFPSTTVAQDDGLSLGAAQTRTTYARKQMQAMQKALKAAEASEEAALSNLDDSRKLQDEARKTADQATEERQLAEKRSREAEDKWSRESERLKRIYQREHTNNPAR